MSSQPECEVCLEPFDENDHSPRSLICGHTMCTTCITSTLVSNEGTLLCPFCRIASTSSLTTKSVKDFPINYSLLKLLQPAYEKPTCSTQEGPSTKEDEEALRKIKQMELDSVSAQLLTCEDHLNQLNQQKVFLNAQQKVLDTQKRKFEDTVTRHQKLLALTENQVKDKIKNVEDLHAKGSLIQTAIQENKDKLDESFNSDITNTANLPNHNDALLEWTKNTIPHQDSEPLISTVESITSATSKSIHSLTELAGSIRSKGVDTSISEVHSSPSISGNIVNFKSSLNPVKYTKTTIPNREDNTSTNDDQIQQIAELLQSSKKSSLTCNQTGSPVNSLDASTQLGRSTTILQDLRTILEDAQIRGQSVYAVTEPKQPGEPRRAAQIKVVDGETLLYCLQTDVNFGHSQKIPYGSIEHLVPISGARTFLEVSWTNKLRGRIIIKMLCETNRGKQFELMCSGKFGPSYIDTKLDQVKAVHGSYVQGGNYDGKGGKALLIDLENGGKCSHKMKDGIVVGSSMSTLFIIHHKSSSYQNTMAFGEVEKGMETVRFIPKISDAKISNCGLILEI